LNPAASMPAMAHASSLSEVSPEMPTAPTTSPAPLLISTPPGLVTMRPPLAAASMVKNCGVRARGKRARAEAHAERAPGFAEGDVEAQEARLVLALERNEVPTGIEHGDRERRAIGIAALLERGVDDGGGLRERDDGHGGSIDAVTMVSSPRKRRRQ
jgi:hypothetical protein